MADTELEVKWGERGQLSVHYKPSQSENWSCKPCGGNMIGVEGVPLGPFPRSATAGAVNTHLWEKMKNSSPKKLSADCCLPPFTKIFCQQSADCWPFVGDCRPTVGSMSVICRVSVENPCRIPEKPQLAGKNIAYRREMKLSHLSPPYCLGFLGTNLLAISYV